MTIASIGERRKPLSFYLLWPLLLGTPWAEAAPYIRVMSETLSEPVSVSSAFGDWGGSFTRGERQWSSNWLEIGYRRGRYGIGALARIDYDLRFDPDTAEIYYKVNNEQSLAQGRRYTLDLNAKRFHAHGLRFSFQDELSHGVSLSAGLSLFNTQRLVDGYIRGYATAINDRDYDYRATVDYHYHKDHLFGREVDTPSDGKGVALDIGLAYRSAHGHQLSLNITDLTSRIWWGEVPHTLANVRVAEFIYDENGQIIGKTGSITGVESIRSHTTSLLPRWHLAGEYAIDEQWHALLDYRHQYGHGLYAAGVSFSSGRHTTALRYWPELGSLGVDYRIGRLKTSLTASGLTPNQANAYWLNFAWN